MIKQGKVYKGRVEVQRNTRTETHADSRTQRERTRGDAERAAVAEELEAESGE